MLEEFSDCDSFVGHLDPRVKIAVVFLFSVVVAVSDRFTVLMMALATGSVIVLMTGTPIKEVLRRLVPVNLLILFLWFFLPFTYPGKPLMSLGPLTTTHEGVLYATGISIKSNAVMLMLIALVSSTSIFTLGHALHKLGISKKIVYLFFFTYRYIYVIHREYVRLANSVKIRSFSPGTDLHTYRTYAYMVGMLLVKSFDRAQRVQNAMLCRGFKGNLYCLSEFSMKGKDVVALVLMAAVILVLGILEWTTITL